MKNKNANAFVLITGASEGFGKSLALEFARRDKNLLLVALPGAELHHLRAFIIRNYNVDVVCIEADLSTLEDCVKIYEEVTTRQLHINTLINNAGIGGTHLFEERNVGEYH